MGLLDLVKEYDGVGPATYRLGQLTALIVTHVSGRGTNELGDLVALYELRHVEGDERVLATKEELGERLGELGLADTGGSEEDERASGTTGVLEGRAAAPDGLGHLGHGLLLAHDALVQSVLAAQELGGLGLRDVGDGDARDIGHDVGDVFVGDDRHGLVGALAP